MYFSIIRTKRLRICFNMILHRKVETYVENEILHNQQTDADSYDVGSAHCHRSHCSSGCFGNCGARVINIETAADLLHKAGQKNRLAVV